MISAHGYGKAREEMKAFLDDDGNNEYTNTLLISLCIGL
jgi:hypothetical protein